MNVITLEDDAFNAFLNQIKQLFEKIEILISTEQALMKQEGNKKNKLEKRWLDGPEVCEYLHVTNRTLQNYRDKGIIPYTTLGGKIIYIKNQIDEILENNIIEAQDQREN
jgi:hypothetical protein